MITRMETNSVWVPKDLPCAKALGLPSLNWQNGKNVTAKGVYCYLT